MVCVHNLMFVTYIVAQHLEMGPNGQHASEQLSGVGTAVRGDDARCRAAYSSTAERLASTVAHTPAHTPVRRRVGGPSEQHLCLSNSGPAKP